MSTKITGGSSGASGGQSIDAADNINPGVTGQGKEVGRSGAAGKSNSHQDQALSATQVIEDAIEASLKSAEVERRAEYADKANYATLTQSALTDEKNAAQENFVSSVVTSSLNIGAGVGGGVGGALVAGNFGANSNAASTGSQAINSLESAETGAGQLGGGFASRQGSLDSASATAVGASEQPVSQLMGTAQSQADSAMAQAVNIEQATEQAQAAEGTAVADMK